ncbi:MAG TPA: DnaA N-terminal domain-containing protein [Herpetosiphonaceae bacterium]
MPTTPLCLDWTPLVSPTGVLLVQYLAAEAVHQRAKRPLLLPPAAPNPAMLQARLGLHEPWQIAGPLYLLTVTGLLLRPPWVPPAGPDDARGVVPAEPPPLDWTVLDRVFTALLPALDPTQAEHPLALAAVQALRQAGLLQAADPAALFYEDGVWPDLLPHLIRDARWVRLFSELHGATALLTYRRQARAWIAQAARVRARRDQAQAELSAYLVTAQQRDDGGGGSDPTTGSGMDSGGAGWFGGDAMPLAPADAPMPTPDAPAEETVVPGEDDATTQDAAAQAYVAGDHDYGLPPSARSLPDYPCVAGDSDPPATLEPMSLADHGDVAGDPAPRATHRRQPLQEPSVPVSPPIASLSLADRSLTENLKATQESTNDTIPTATHDSPSDTISETVGDMGLDVERYLDAAELASTRQDAAFWQAVNRILTGSDTRYPHTPGEKKAAERQFKRWQIPIGIILAALRAVVSLPDRPRTFSDAITSDTFQACVEQALTLLPAHLPQLTEGRDWFAFLHVYRQIGRADHLRDVRPADYHALQELFTAQEDACWRVVERWTETPPPRVSPAALRRALQHGALRHRRFQPPLPLRDVPARAADDPRHTLLRAAGVSTSLLTPAMTEDYLRAWIAEADARAEDLKNRAAWLTWGIGSGHLPQDHPQLPPRRPAARPAPPVAAPPPPPPISAEQRAWQEVWSGVQRQLLEHVPTQDYATWLEQTALVELTPGEAIVATPNIFARDQVTAAYVPLIAHALQQQTRQVVQVQVVLEPSQAVYRSYA